jgi:amidase
MTLPADILASDLPADILASDLPADITDLSASNLSAAIRQRHVTCVEVMQAYLQRIHRYNPSYTAIVSMLDDDELIAQAELADAALDNDEYWGWMHGMPHAIKDLSNAKGLETSEGSPIFAGTIAEEDDLHVARIRQQGAIFIGKTNTPEFGLGSQSYNPVHGTTGSAYDPSLTAGGSSGGAACAMATHMVPIADGSDMMGSLRNPGAFNNVIGFRPSQGRVPSVPSSDPFYGQLSTSGPMGRNVEDTIRLLLTMAGYDSRAPLSRKDVLPSFDRFRPAELTGYRIGWMGDYEGYLATEPGVMAVCEAALAGLSSHGVAVENCQPDYDMARLWETWLTFRHWALSTAKELYDDPALKAQLRPEIIWEIEGSFGMTAARVTEAAIARGDWYKALHALFERYDILALPTAQVFPFDKTVHWPKEVNGRAMDTYHRWMEVVIGGTLSGNPVANVPAGFDERGRPMGIQLIGRMGQDKEVLELAMAWEAATDYLDVRPTMVEA